MRITQEGGRTIVDCDHIGQLEAVYAVLRVVHPSLHHIRKRNPRMEKWDGIVKFYEQGVHELQVLIRPGHLQRLRMALDAQKVKYDFYTDQRPDDGIPFDQLLDGVTLDEDQVQACKALLDNERCSLEFKTGGGKTEIATNAMLCAFAANQARRVLFVVPRLNLLYQTVARLEKRLGMKVGIVGDGHFEIESPVVISTADSACGAKHLARSTEVLAWLRTIDILILDEAHHSTSSMWGNLIDRCPARRLWALSGKVTFIDKKNMIKHLTLEGIFGPPVHSGSSSARSCPVSIICHKDLSWAGIFDGEGLSGSLTDCTQALYRHPGGKWEKCFWRGPNAEGQSPQWMLQKVVDRRGNQSWELDKTMYGIYTSDHLKFGDECAEREAIRACKIDVPSEDILYWTRHDIGIMEFAERNKWAVRLAGECHRRREPFVMSVKRKKHLVRMERLLTRAGIKVGVVSGSITGTKQSKIIGKVADGQLPGLIGIYSTVGEGMDIPCLVHYIKLDGVTDEMTLEQQKGRVQRVCEGKERGYMHLPRDTQLSALDKNTGHVLQYYRNTKLDVRTIVVDEKTPMLPQIG